MVFESAKLGSWKSNGDVWEHEQSPVCSFMKCYLQWQSEAEQGGSWRDGQECVETDWERSVLFVQVCVCVCELHPPVCERLEETEMWFQLRPFLKVRKHAGTSNKQEIFSAANSALFSFYCQTPLSDFSKAPTSFAAFSSFHRQTDGDVCDCRITLFSLGMLSLALWLDTLKRSEIMVFTVFLALQWKSNNFHGTALAEVVKSN